MSDKKDPNYEKAEKTMKALMRLVSDPDLGEDLLENPIEDGIEYVILLTKALALESDTWFYYKFSPRTVLYAILINTVHEYIVDNEKKHKTHAFWVDLSEKLRVEKKKVEQIAENVKPGDKINIDIYHEMFRGDLDVNTQ